MNRSQLLEQADKVLEHEFRLTVGTCNCFTKTNDIGFHDVTCRYRVGTTAVNAVRALSEHLKKTEAYPVWICNSFAGHWLTGTAIVSAATIQEAVTALNIELSSRGLVPSVTEQKLTATDMTAPSAHVNVMNDGNY